MSPTPQQNPKARKARKLRITVVLPFVLSMVTFILNLLVLLSGTKPGMLENLHFVTLNTSGIGQDLVEFSPATNSSGLLNNIAASADERLNNEETTSIRELASTLGLMEFYSYHLRSICWGNFSSTSDPHASYTIYGCSSYSDARIDLANATDTIRSPLTLGTTNITLPVLSILSSVANYLSTTPGSLARTAFVFFVLTDVVIGVFLPLSVLAGLRPSSRPFFYCSFILSMLNPGFQLGALTVSLFLIASLQSSVTQSGSAVGVSATNGVMYITYTGVGSLLLFLGNLYWSAIWFVEYRTRSYKARRRTPVEIGHWRGIGKEVLSDLRILEEDMQGAGWETVEVVLARPK